MPLLVAGCVDAPAAPPPQADLSVDYAAFDHPTAVLPDASVQTIATSFAAAGTLPEGMGAFGLIRKLVSDTNQALANETGLLDQFTVDGTAIARLPCTAGATTPPIITAASVAPSDDSTAALDPSAIVVGGDAGTGQLTFNIGVENSNVQRTLRGSAQNCQLVLPSATALPVVTTGSADLTVDLGQSLALGADLTLPILVQATHVQAVDGTSIDTAALAPTGDEVRVTNDGAIQILVQPSTFGAPVM
ncbi:MAG TPA: hypothetical protein VGL13_07470, partial [Polyangiaceae bacterium]